MGLHLYLSGVLQGLGDNILFKPFRFILFIGIYGVAWIACKLAELATWVQIPIDPFY